MNRDELEKLLVRAHVEAMHAWDYGATEKQMEDVLMLIRHAQWRWDFAAAGHGSSFHSPVEVGRIISTGIIKAQEARVKLARVLASLGYNEEVPYPDIQTKEKAQKFIGLPMEELIKEKNEFIKNVVPEWDRKAKERHQDWDKDKS
jgi:nitrite reductase (cytochrome c-552)